MDPVTGELLEPKLGSKRRVFLRIPYKYQGITLRVRKIMPNITLFRRALLSPAEVNILISKSWHHSYTGDAQLEEAGVPNKAFSYVYLQDTTCGMRILIEAVKKHLLSHMIGSGKPVPCLYP